MKRKVKEIADRKAEKTASLKAKRLTVSDACDRWIASQKVKSEETAVICRRSAKMIRTWAEDWHIQEPRDVTANLLDESKGL